MAKSKKVAKGKKSKRTSLKSQKSLIQRDEPSYQDELLLKSIFGEQSPKSPYWKVGI